MARKRNYLLARYYLKLHLWLRHRCDRLTVRQRKAIVYGLSLVYLVCSIWMIAQYFLPPKGGSTALPHERGGGQPHTNGQPSSYHRKHSPISM